MNDKLSLSEHDGAILYIDKKGFPWMTQRQIGEWLSIDKSTVSRIIKSTLANQAIHEVSELYKIPVVAKDATTAFDGKNYQVNFYNMFVIIMVALRANKSDQAVRFQVWALRLLGKSLVSDLKQYNANLEYELAELNELYEEIQSQLYEVETNAQVVFDIAYSSLRKARDAEERAHRAEQTAKDAEERAYLAEQEANDIKGKYLELFDKGLDKYITDGNNNSEK